MKHTLANKCSVPLVKFAFCCFVTQQITSHNERGISGKIRYHLSVSSYIYLLEIQELPLGYLVFQSKSQIIIFHNKMFSVCKNFNI